MCRHESIPVLTLIVHTGFDLWDLTVPFSSSIGTFFVHRIKKYRWSFRVEFNVMLENVCIIKSWISVRYVFLLLSIGHLRCTNTNFLAFNGMWDLPWELLPFALHFRSSSFVKTKSSILFTNLRSGNFAFTIISISVLCRLTLTSKYLRILPVCNKKQKSDHSIIVWYKRYKFFKI